MNNKDHLREYFENVSKFPKRYRFSYFPWYDDLSDYNTNAKSYYDYLARNNRILEALASFVNRLLDRDIEVRDTYSVDLEIIGNWLDNGECAPNNYDDIITLLANVILSPHETNYSFDRLPKGEFLHNLRQKTYVISNAIKEFSSGLYAPDYKPILDDLFLAVEELRQDLNLLRHDHDQLRFDHNKLSNEFNTLKADHEKLKNALQKILNSLNASGALTNTNIDNYEFKSGVSIATGNINFFSEQPDGNKFIRTNTTGTTGDITAGYHEGDY